MKDTNQIVPLYRHDAASGRAYARVVEGNERNVVWYPSVTTVLRGTSPMSPGLLKWYAQHGEEKANAMRDAAAEYGTALHIAIHDLSNGARLDAAMMPTRMAKDLLAWQTFLTDYKIEILYAEPMVYSDEFGFAGAIDIVCTMEVSEGVRAVAIIDIKSGSGSYSDHAVQLAMYQLAWNERYGEPNKTIVEEIYNWHPKDWREKPTYTLKKQTGAVTKEEIKLRCDLYRATNKIKPSKRLVVEGTFGVLAEFTMQDADVDVLAKHAAYVGDDLQTITNNNTESQSNGIQ